MSTDRSQELRRIICQINQRNILQQNQLSGASSSSIAKQHHASQSKSPLLKALASFLASAKRLMREIQTSETKLLKIIYLQEEEQEQQQQQQHKQNQRNDVTHYNKSSSERQREIETLASMIQSDLTEFSSGIKQLKSAAPPHNNTAANSNNSSAACGGRSEVALLMHNVIASCHARSQELASRLKANLDAWTNQQRAKQQQQQQKDVMSSANQSRSFAAPPNQQHFNQQNQYNHASNNSNGNYAIGGGGVVAAEEVGGEGGFGATELQQVRQRGDATHKIRDLQETIINLSEMFQQFSSIVEEQDVVIEHIDAHTRDAEFNVTAAHEQLLKRLRNISGNRRLMIKVFAALVALFLLFNFFLF